MKRIRVIPILLLQNNGLVKTVRFKKTTYIGDPINAVKIFNEKEVDELAFIDIEATVKNKEPDYNKIEEIASECFMPLAYGGGIKNLEQVKRIFAIGVEKVIINSAIILNRNLISEGAKIYGNQSIVVSVDVKKDFFGKYNCYFNSGKNKIKTDFITFVKEIEQLGAGEIVLTSIDREGTFKGYDLELIKQVTKNVNIPVIANGGASCVEDFEKAVNIGGASAVSAGSLFVYKSENRGVLINYPSQNELKEKLFSKIQIK
ncbi:MAG: imidazole glycerol phosphate synthase subunit HisF [Bacteroidales bacterium]|nr:imidazole glycerol phosphate synthase subunit HisF [Bacteroidales bacterium]